MVAVDHEAVHGTRLDSHKKQIRLLQILPRHHRPSQDLGNSDDDTVHCQMFKTCLGEDDPRPPLFNALSYAWGNPSNVTNMVVNETTMTVTSNLESALRHLRDHHIWTTSGFPLWVDAVCINQEDAEERDDQVDMMGDIYRRAHRVLAWLGEGDSDTDWLVPLLGDRGFREQVKKADMEADFAPGAVVVRAAVILMYDLFRRAWWERLWVSQEIILAEQDPVLLFGSKHVSWANYTLTADHLEAVERRIGISKEYIAAENALIDVQSHSDSRFICNKSDNRFPGFAWKELDQFRATMRTVGFIPMCTLYTEGRFVEAFATKKADFVYALRGLLPVEEQQLIQVEYSKPHMQVFHDAMIVAWTSSFGSDDVGEMPARLNFRRANSDEVDDVPSWVPDLSQQRRTRPFMGSGESWKTTDLQLSADKQVLTLRGIYFDAVSETCSVRFEWFKPAFLGLSVSLAKLGDLKQAAHITSAALGRRIPPSDPLHAMSEFRDFEQGRFHLQRLLVGFGFLDFSGAQNESTWLWRGLWDQLLSLVEAEGDPNDPVAAFLALGQYAEEELRRRPVTLTTQFCVAQFFHKLKLQLDGTAVFTTRAGFIGVGPGHMQSGDRIVFPFGMKWPFVVRPLHPERTGNHEYKMIGVVDIPELSDMDRRERLDQAFEGGLFEEIDIHLK